MNPVSLNNFTLHLATRQWFGRKRPNTVAPENTATATDAPTPEPAPKPKQLRIPMRARYQQIDPALSHWYAAQPHPCTIVVFVNDATGNITQFSAIAGSHIRKLFTTHTAMTDNAEWFWANPHCLRRKEADLSQLAQAPNTTVYGLLQLLETNKAAIEEMVIIANDTYHAFIQAFYNGMPTASINASAQTTTPREVAWAELVGLLSARDGLVAQLNANLNAFHDGWQNMGLSESDIAPMPEQALSHAEE